ncbi:hypothetical protein [Chondrinema litorale]|uniref:hypothetical protein n=1 Tax=Chondrinema litorale TaxID=2994555 RepID=UPI0025439BCA|nr:hypothetical protein [Chondrinema litorale]UZR94587.1 hypothetical protein OQ292_01980 [Chondrinema litorale]
MKFKYLLLILLAPLVLQAQQNSQTYEIKNPGPPPAKECESYMELYRHFPPEVRYGLKVENGTIYFIFRNEDYLKKTFSSNTDGIAVDVNHRNLITCNGRVAPKTNIHYGYLLEPMFRKEMFENMEVSNGGFIKIKYRKLPSGFNPDMVECNLLIIQKKYACGYHGFTNLDYSNWGILDMGLYKDSIPSDSYHELSKEVKKELKFVIPFEKNKVAFETSDIQPLYDSLNLTDYNITEINIKAYSSVEGTVENNMKLQEGRAKSIIDALQTYQKPEIVSNVSAKENWVEFLVDITNSKYEYLSKLSQEAIKQELQNKTLLSKLEPILQSHRKAMVELKLEKKFTEIENDPVKLKALFDQNIQESNIEEALYLQKIIFEKVRDKQFPDDYIGKLDVPEEVTYGALLNNFAIFEYEQENFDLYENIKHFERLLEILPGNLKVKYNLLALKMQSWNKGEIVTNQKEVNNSINELQKLGLEKSLVRRLRMNYYIILTQYKAQEQDYNGKSNAIKEVYFAYSGIDLNDKDLVCLAKYLAVYSKFAWAEEVLAKRIDAIDVDEDLIFYYLKLTIANRGKTQDPNYRTFMLNAVDKNTKRYCDIFLPISQGGLTFQLLDDKFIRDTYCEVCNE